MKYFLKTVLIIVIVVFFGLVIIQAYSNAKSKKALFIPSATPTPSLSSTPTSLPTLTPTTYSYNGIKLFVKPDGDDNNDGRSVQSAFRSIQKAVDTANPGDTINLGSGTYFQDIITKKDGLPNSPILITGPKTAIVKGAGNPRVFEINHSYITLNGFTIDGLHGSSTSKSGYRDKLIYVLAKSPGKGVTNIKILNMDIKNAGGECVRLRYFAQNNEIAYNNIGPCGAIDFIFADGGKNGEGIYIGTAPEQRDNKTNPTKDIDQSNNNWIHHNQIDTQGNECVDIKEGSEGNVVEYNNCTGQRDSESGGMDSRGNGNIFRYNEIFKNDGAGVRLGGDKKNDGINNDVYGNIIRDNASGGIKIQRDPQGKICGNVMERNIGGNLVGTDNSKIDPEKSCL